MIDLIPVKTDEQVEWLRIQRNRPELYRYFRQDVPITPEQQKSWWRNSNKNELRLFIVEDAENAEKRVGYVGFNPLFQRGCRAEFGIFILPEHDHKGYGTQALQMLLNKGFGELSLSTIYSDVLDYPHENRFEFYKNMGFMAFPAEHQNIRYKKHGEWVNSIKFFMTKDMWEKHGKDGDGGLGPVGSGPQKRGRPKGSKNKSKRLHPSKNNVNKAAK